VFPFKTVDTDANVLAPPAVLEDRVLLSSALSNTNSSRAYQALEVDDDDALPIEALLEFALLSADDDNTRSSSTAGGASTLNLLWPIQQCPTY